MRYLLGTVALVRHFTGKGKIGERASHILDNIEYNENRDEFVISVISLMEVMYLAEKNRIEINLSETIDVIESSSKYTIANLNPDILRVAESTAFYELHDRLILATAKWLGIKIISSDGKFDSVEGVNVVWD
ncbi:PIN domain-containing protein [Desulfococcaceae bacterium HSG9]|nr:PIN domain-containing protein [Desulfococcaceae bacterium HSG9]